MYKKPTTKQLSLLSAVAAVAISSTATASITATYVAGTTNATDASADLTGQGWSTPDASFSADYDGPGGTDTTGVPSYIVTDTVSGYGVTPVLRVNDDGSNGAAKVMFKHTIADAAVTGAWKLSALAKVSSIGDGGNLSYNDNRPGASWFLMAFLENGAGNIEVWRRFAGNNVNRIDTGIANDGAYHTFDMRSSDAGVDGVWGTGDDSVNIYVDNVLQGAVDARADSTALAGSISFGSDYTAGVSDTSFKEVTFTSVPEPSSVALLGLGGLAGLLRRKR